VPVLPMFLGIVYLSHVNLNPVHTHDNGVDIRKSHFGSLELRF